jgi:ChrB, C-terminal domain
VGKLLDHRPRPRWGVAGIGAHEDEPDDAERSPSVSFDQDQPPGLEPAVIRGASGCLRHSPSCWRSRWRPRRDSLKRARLRDRRLVRLAEVVHEADLRDGKYVREEARGIDVAVRALLAASSDDHQVLAQGMALFEGLYATTSRKGAS